MDTFSMPSLRATITFAAINTLCYTIQGVLIAFITRIIGSFFLFREVTHIHTLNTIGHSDLLPTYKNIHIKASRDYSDSSSSVDTSDLPPEGLAFPLLSLVVG